MKIKKVMIMAALLLLVSLVSGSCAGRKCDGQKKVKVPMGSM